MRKNTRSGLLLLSAATLVAGGGVAYTAANTVPSSVAGYGSSTVSGATANSISYTLSTDSTQITGASVVFAGDLTGSRVTAGFGTGTSASCTLATYNATAATTTATCSGFTQSTSTATTFNVAVVK